MASNLVLSLFPGLDLLGKGFELEGYCVVRGPELLLGSRVESFSAPAHVFLGVVGGSPCQDFSRARRAPVTGLGVLLLNEFRRVVTEAAPEWFLLENVTGVPDVVIDGYYVQRLNINAKECGVRQNRLRCFQFGSRDGRYLFIPRQPVTRRGIEPCCMASEGERAHRRAWADFCELQGLPRDFDLPAFSIGLKYKLVGNAVPLPMARALAIAVKTRGVTSGLKPCVCECGRPAKLNALHATPACRKRMERRRRDTTAVTGPGEGTPAVSQPSLTAACDAAGESHLECVVPVRSDGLF